ncbi:MAG TPA: serine hydrolase [Gammaproteobacteria bacterium]|nr:serine hydrolase [Gammaproteobacteria bacterium]
MHSNGLDEYIHKKITEGLVPGAVLMISSQGKIVHEAAYGCEQLFYLDQSGFRASDQSYPLKIAANIKPLTTTQSITVNHIFDLASVTKVLVTSFAIMLLLDAGSIALNKPLHQYLPIFNTADKRDITLAQLITHSAGFIPWVPLYYHADNPKDAINYIAQLSLQYLPGTQYLYSDLGFITLGYLIEQITGYSLDNFIKKYLFHKLNLHKATFNPDKHKYPFAATSHGNPYEYNLITSNKFGSQQPEDIEKFTKWRDYTLIGEVSDGNAFYAFHDIAGHAGLFATAAEVNTLLELVNNHGYFSNKLVIKPETIKLLTRDCGLHFCLGWKIFNQELQAVLAQTDFVTHKVIGHLGFTGTLVLCIPEQRLNIILLTNRQNLGLNAQGVYNDLTEFRQEVIRKVITSFPQTSKKPN